MFERWSSMKRLMCRMIYPLRLQSHKVITNTSLSVKLCSGRDECLHSHLEETFVLFELLFPSLIIRTKCRLCSSTQWEWETIVLTSISWCLKMWFASSPERSFRTLQSLVSESNPDSLRFVIITVISNNEKQCLLCAHVNISMEGGGMGQVIREQG